MNNSPWQDALKKNFSQYLIITYQAFAILIYVLMLASALDFFRVPFLGVFLEQTMLTNKIGPEAPDKDWPLFERKGLNEFGHQLIELSILNSDGSEARTLENITSYRQIRNFLAGNNRPGESVRAIFKAPDGSVRAYDSILTSFNNNAQVSYFYFPYFIGLIYLLIGAGVLWFRRNETAGRAFSILGASVAIAVGGLLDLYAMNYFTPVWVMAVPLVGASMIHLAMVFPQEARLVLRYPYLRWVGYIPAAVLVTINWVTLYDFTDPGRYAQVWFSSYVYTGLGIVFFVGMVFYRRYRSPSPVARQQARTILFGAVIGFLPITLWLLTSPLDYLKFNPYIFFMPLVVFPATTGYVVMRYRLLRTDYLLGRGVLYGALSLLAIGGYMLLTMGVSMIFGSSLPVNSPGVIAVAVLLTALLLNPVRMRLQGFIDSIFFRGEKAHQERLKIFTREMTDAIDSKDVMRILREQITVSLLPSQLHLFVFDPLTETYIANADETGHITTDVRFSPHSPLTLTLAREKVPLFVDGTHLSGAIQAERGRLAVLGTQLFIPLPGRENLVGWISLGERLSGEVYASHDISFLEAMGDQSAVALERAQVVRNLERRVHEMNVLARVSQGINITLSFDDILELIYAQSAQIIPGSDFHLTLYDKVGRSFYYAFCLENDDRIIEKENQPLNLKTTLGQEVITSRRSIMTQDYLSQCQMMGVVAEARGIYAWLGVPLNTGAETIGALSIASHDSTVVYTDNQMELFQSIADQAAGAIVKSRLLQETERRAQQLATLNVIARQLASTLELEPLLENILESAVEILNSEAGSLFLVDAQTDELIFQVTVGPVASNLVGQRLPAGTGFVGKAVNSRAPVIVNDVAATTTWNSGTDKQTGFITKAILAVPMEVKDRVIGVIEIINKKDGLPFTKDDENLLSAFGGQAAVAIENARLYTLTDQELNARLEELSVMQRIDRELNASLEVDRAMRITLEWAMRQSMAEAGFIGFVEAKGVALMAKQGYARELDDYAENYMPRTHKAFAKVIEGGSFQRSTLASGDLSEFLPGTRSQIVIPIRREASVIGLFLLESANPDGFQQDEQNFLSRLADHAAIAIANAQLYAEVQQANVAKSEFVSFVAHELKNPMTSIKGWSELLAGGAVGPINDMQSNALGTIRGNIERMKTIVEDLNDNAKIEAGRLRLEFKAVDVPDVMEAVVRSTKRQLEDKKQTIEVQQPEGLPNIWADRTRIEQIVVNLVSNSHKYTQEGGHIEILVEKSQNIWDEQGAPEVVHIAVKDNGIGMTPEDQKKIFQRYFRSEDDQARKSPGTGLGLNITKSLVEMQGGRIWFESEFRKGTIFHFTVPVSEN